MQYTKEQLSGMSVDELRNIAEELGIKSAKLEQMDLVYEILDKSAIVSAADKAAKQTTAATRKRTRIKTVDRVYTANQDKAKKVDKTMKVSVDDSLFASLSDDEKKMMVEAQQDEKGKETANAQETVAEAPKAANEEAPKKRTRKTKKTEEKTEDMNTEKKEENPAEAPEPKKRTRKKAEVKTETQPEPEVKAETDAPAEDFIVMEMTDADGKVESPATQEVQAVEPKQDAAPETADAPQWAGTSWK